MGYFKILILALIMLTTTNLEANIEIKYKIDGEIITNIDLLNEKNYLIFLRPSLAKLSEEEILNRYERAFFQHLQTHWNQTQN